MGGGWRRLSASRRSVASPWCSRQLLGNGQDMAQQAFLGHVTLGLAFALFALKPLVTALRLGSGATGGLFTRR